VTAPADPRILILDTDVASKLQVDRLRPDYMAVIDTYDLLAITWITEAEWLTGLHLKDNPQRQQRFEEWMSKLLHLSQDSEVTRRYAELASIAAQHGEGTKKRQNDTWIAATAVRHDTPLMTLNRGDFMVYAKHGGLRLEPPPD
jgi:tRNA(fMet)-specific endonuclease VapC